MFVFRIGLFLLAGLLAWIPSAEPVRACAIAAPRDFEPSVVDETALIVYDSATKTEHFLRMAKFETNSADFGFFVPTPSQPELAEASDVVFFLLGKITEPGTVQRIVKQHPQFACSGSASSSPGYTRSPAVTVVEQKRIGTLDASVLKATDGAALQDWLKKSGYSTRPALVSWFEEYIRLGWFITAFKIASGRIELRSTRRCG